MNGEEGSRHSARALRNIARVDYKSLHRAKSNRMSSIEEDPKSYVVTGDMSSLDGASGGLGNMRDSPHSKPRSGERDVSGDDDLEMLRVERERDEITKGRRTSSYHATPEGAKFKGYDFCVNFW